MWESAGRPLAACVLQSARANKAQRVFMANNGISAQHGPARQSGRAAAPPTRRPQLWITLSNIRHMSMETDLSLHLPSWTACAHQKRAQATPKVGASAAASSAGRFPATWRCSIKHLVLRLQMALPEKETEMAQAGHTGCARRVERGPQEPAATQSPGLCLRSTPRELTPPRATCRRPPAAPPSSAASGSPPHWTAPQTGCPPAPSAS